MLLGCAEIQDKNKIEIEFSGSNGVFLPPQTATDLLERRSHIRRANGGEM